MKIDAGIRKRKLRMTRAAERAALIAEHIADLTSMYERGLLRVPTDSTGETFLGPEETRQWIIRGAYS